MGHKILYQNHRKLTLHAVSLLTLALAAFVVYMIFFDLDGFFSEFSSQATGIAWIIFFLLAGNSMLVCMFWLSGRYVLEITKLENQEELIIKTWSIFGFYHKKRCPAGVLENPEFRFGKANFSHVPTVNAPWWKLKDQNGRTLVVDMNGKFFLDFKEKTTLKNI